MKNRARTTSSLPLESTPSSTFVRIVTFVQNHAESPLLSTFVTFATLLGV